MGGLAEVSQKILADLSGPIRERVRTERPAAPMIGALGKASRCLADEWGVPAAQQAAIIFPWLVQLAQRERDAEGALPLPPIGV